MSLVFNKAEEARLKQDANRRAKVVTREHYEWRVALVTEWGRMESTLRTKEGALYQQRGMIEKFPELKIYIHVQLDLDAANAYSDRPKVYGKKISKTAGSSASSTS